MLKEGEILSKCPSCGSRYKVPLGFLGKTLSCKGCGIPFKLTPSSSVQTKDPHPERPTPEDKVQEIGVEDPCLVLGRLAIKYGYANEEHIREALERRAKEKESGREIGIGQILREKGMISEDQFKCLISVQGLLEMRQLDIRFGTIAVQNGFACEEDVQKVLQEQKRIFKETGAVKPIGEILVETGVISQEQKNGILERQRRLQAVSPSRADAPAEPQGPFELTLSEGGLSATISLRGPEPCGSAQEVRSFLAAKGVSYGIVDDQEIEKCLKDGKPFQVAQGKPPVQGGEPVIRYSFNTDPLKVGEIKEGGVIDFRARGPVPQVKKGDLLAEKVWPADRAGGINVFGKEIDPSESGSVFLRPGKGTRISEDGRKLYSDADGKPELRADGKVYVFSDMEVDGDVDLKTGNIDFQGNIVVSGTVQSGFRIKGGSLTANEVLKAEIETAGDVAVFGGVIGAKIKAGGNLRARYIHDSNVEVLGDIAVEKEIIETRIETSGLCSIKNGHIRSCQIEAKKGIEAAQIGSESSRQCILVVGTNERARNEIERMRGERAKKKEEKKLLALRLQEFEKESQRITDKIGVLAQEQDRAMVNRRKVSAKLEEMLKADSSGKQWEAAQTILKALDQEIRDRDGALEADLESQEKIAAQAESVRQEMLRLDQESAAIEEEISSIAAWAKADRGNPVVKCSGEINQSTVIKGTTASIVLPESHTGVVIQEVKARGADDKLGWRMKISRL
jgi:uncharacterized protein